MRRRFLVSRSRSFEFFETALVPESGEERSGRGDVSQAGMACSCLEGTGDGPLRPVGPPRLQWLEEEDL